MLTVTIFFNKHTISIFIYYQEKSSMKNFSKKLITLTLLACSFGIVQAKKLDKIQILVNPAAAWFKFAMNTGGAITPNPLALRPTGATYIANGLIYPGGTIDTKNQASFLVDKHGNILTPANSIGTFWESSDVLIDYELLVTPAQGVAVNLSTYAFYFNKKESTITGEGFLQSTGVMAPHQAGYKGVFGETGGTGKNQKVDHDFKVKFIPSPGFTTLVIEVKFDKKIDV